MEAVPSHLDHLFFSPITFYQYPTLPTMNNIVHKTKLLVCQWTGETILKRFRIPQNGSIGSFTGCYGSPSTALAALNEYISAKALSDDQAHELFNMFQASLRKGADYEKDTHVVQAAPNYHLIDFWGGRMSLEEFHKMYNHAYQIKAYDQEVQGEHNIPPTEETQSDAPTTSASTRAHPWYHSVVDPKAPKEGGNKTEPIEMPRCAAQWIEFLRVNNPDKEHSPNAIVFYFPVSDKNIFALGSPHAFNVTGNRPASQILKNTCVFGPVTFYHKRQLLTGVTMVPNPGAKIIDDEASESETETRSKKRPVAKRVPSPKRVKIDMTPHIINPQVAITLPGVDEALRLAHVEEEARHNANTEARVEKEFERLGFPLLDTPMEDTQAM